MYAVITGDIKNFTALNSLNREKLAQETEKLVRTLVQNDTDAQLFRGDSYQFVLNPISQALKKCVRLICWFKMSSTTKSKVSTIRSGKKLGTRLSIGIGEIAYRGKTVLDSDGEAFHLSGRMFDEMSKDELIRLSTSNEEKNQVYQIILMYINSIMKQWTASQAETIYQLLSIQEGTQEKVAKHLNMTQPAVASSLRSARWKEVEKGLDFITKELEKQYRI